MDRILAKSKENGGVTLYEHSISTMNVVKKICKDGKIDEKYASICIISALFHDIGKVHHLFQDKLSGKSVEDYGYYHNILSAKIFSECIVVENIQIDRAKELITKIILYHHPVDNKFQERGCPFFANKDERLEHVSDDDIKLALSFADKFVSEYNTMAESLGYKSRLKACNSPLSTMNDFTYFSESSSKTSNNHILAYATGVLKFADIISSSGNSIETYTNLITNISPSDFICPEKYDLNRFSSQMLSAMEMGENPVSILMAPTSFGKTMVGLRWGLCNGRKLIWVCPTNGIATSMYHSIKNELSALNLQEKVNVGLLLTNEWQHGEKFGTLNDIIVTNIDNYARPVFKSDKKKHLSFNINHSNVVFDEYHQYATDDAIMAQFITSLRARVISNDNRTLLLSATPNIKLYDLGDESNKIYEKMIGSSNVNQKKYRIMYNAGHKDGNTLIVRNSVSSAQSSYRLLPGSHKMLFHAQFIDEHLESNIEMILATHGKNGNDKELTVCATNMATTALDISFARLECSVMPLYEVIQAVGRINRHSPIDDIGEIVIDESSLKDSHEWAAVGVKYDNGLMKMEYEFFKEAFKDGQIITLEELYNLFYRIQENSSYSAAYSKYFRQLKNESFKNFSKIPYLYASEQNGDGKVRISNIPSLRGNNTSCSVFVRCEDGMEQGQFMQLNTLQEEKYYDFSCNMYNYIKKNKLEELYYEKRENYIFDKLFKGNKCEKMARMYIAKAKDCDTPFILPSAKYSYNKEYGLIKH